MFGMGFAEILIIGVIAILFLGPDKLPETMVEIAKFFKNAKKAISSAKDSIEEELHVSELKDSARNYHQELHQAHSELANLTSLDSVKDEINDVKEMAKVDINDSSFMDDEKEEKKAEAAPKKPEVVTFEKRSKKVKKEKTPETETKEA